MPNYFGQLLKEFFLTDVGQNTFLLQSKLLEGCFDSLINYSAELLV